ncbi:unnamed protein product [Mucor hiemalis]
MATSNDIPLTYFINDYTDLCNLLMINLPNTPNYTSPPATTATVKAILAYKTKYSLPKSVRYYSASAHLIENLMFRAVQHWCCISFKIVPIELELIQNDTPKCILYCVAAISIITTTTTAQQKANTITETNKNNKVKKVYDKSAEGFKKDVGFYFYERAVNYLNEVLFSDEAEQLSSSIIAIQCYFCLSYTANLLRLTQEQRTWHYMACDQLISKVQFIGSSRALRQCWYRWYYIDAWIALSLNIECLLPDELPFPTATQSIKKEVKSPPASAKVSATQDSITTIEEVTTIKTNNDSGSNHKSCCIISNETLYEFFIMTQYMRRFNRSIQSGTLPHLYDNLNFELEYWWANNTHKNLHLSICYHSMRLVILFSLLQHSDIYYVDCNLLLDGLNCTLEILQGLQDLRLMKCDQSTYHHMFSAIHRMLKGIKQFITGREELKSLEPYTKQQFEMNLCILESTDAFMNDIYGMRALGSMIEDDLFKFGYFEDEVENTKKKMHVFRAKVPTNKPLKKVKKNHEVKSH